MARPNARLRRLVPTTRNELASPARIICRMANRRQRTRGADRRVAREISLERRIDGTEAHAQELIGGEPMQRLPGWNAQGGLEQLDASAHLDSILRQSPDI